MVHLLSQDDGRVKRSYERSPVIALVTDAADADALPAEARTVGDLVLTTNLDPLESGRVPNSCDGAVLWLKNDRLIQGSPAAIRQHQRTPGRRVFLPVSYPFLDGMDVISLQPRIFTTGPTKDHWDLNLRLRGDGTACEQTLAALRASGEPWAQLALGLFLELARPQAGLETLVRLWLDRGKLPAVLASLVLRNLVLVLIRAREVARAGELLEQGMKAYSGYAELPYLAALLCFREGQFAKMVHYSDKAKTSSGYFVGSGGESTYRLAWLMGLQTARSGSDLAAFQSFCCGMTADPVFTPAVDEILKLRLPPALVQRRQFDFCRMARREPQYLERTFDFLLVHRAFDAARRLLETIPHSPALRSALEKRLRLAAAPFSSELVSEGGKPGVILEGQFLEHSSLARINRELGACLVQHEELEGALEPSAFAQRPAQAFASGGVIERGMRCHPSRLDLTIRHQWPPDFSRPARGRLAVIFPWEFGAVPRVWIDQINRNVDELWVPSRFVRDVFTWCGVPRERIQVIPNGFDPEVFSVKGPAMRPSACRSFMFLYVGGAIRRKGIDVLVEAYRQAFEAGEDVSLLVVALGVQGAYHHNNLVKYLQLCSLEPSMPRLEVLTEELDDAQLAGLYRGCDAFVLPYRAEGFCMPVLEAMACGKAVITTAQGPSQDFCSPETAYLVPAARVPVSDPPPPFGTLAGDFTWFEPDRRELTRMLRHVYECRAEQTPRGAAAAESVRPFRWANITRKYVERILALTNKGIPRLQEVVAASV